MSCTPVRASCPASTIPVPRTRSSGSAGRTTAIHEMRRRPQADRAADALQPDLAVDPLQRLRSLTTAVEEPETASRS